MTGPVEAGSGRKTDVGLSTGPGRSVPTCRPGSAGGSAWRLAGAGRAAGAAGFAGRRLCQTRAVRTIWSFSLSGTSRTQVRGSVR